MSARGRWGAGVLVAALAAGCGATDPPRPARVIHVDASADHGGDGSLAHPLASLSSLPGRPLPAGTVVAVRRGTTLTEPATLTAAGTAQEPVTIEPYGEGPAPVWRLSADDAASCLVLQGRWARVSGLRFERCGWAGISLEGDDLTVADVEASGSTAGVVAGEASLRAVIVRSHLHDHDRMSVNTPEPRDDDSGAFCVLLQGRDAVVADNRLERCAAPSHDYGTDGAGVEVYGASGSQILRNHIVDCAAGIELGGPGTRDTTIAYNVIAAGSLVGARGLVTRGAGDPFGPVPGTRVRNDTILVNAPDGAGIVCGGTCDDRVLTVANAVVSAPEAISGGGVRVERSLLSGQVSGATLVRGTSFLPAPWTDVEAAPPGAAGAGLPGPATFDVRGRPVPAERPTIGALEG